MKKTHILALAILIGLIGYAFWNTDEKQTTAMQITEVEEPVTACIDISTPLTDMPQFEVYVDDSETPLEQASWMAKYNAQGGVIQKEGDKLNLTIKVLNDAVIYVVLKGPWDKDENGNMVEHWIKYTSFTVDGKEILPEAIEVWHNKPFKHTLNAKAGETYKLHFEWTKADK